MFAVEARTDMLSVILRLGKTGLLYQREPTTQWLKGPGCGFLLQVMIKAERQPRVARSRGTRAWRRV